MQAMQGLRRMRKAGRWRAQEIADAIGKTICAVYAYEKGKREPKKATREALCKFFNCKEEDLWE